MSIIALLSAPFCHDNAISKKVSERLGYQLVTDSELIQRTSERFGTSQRKLKHTLHGHENSIAKIVYDNHRDDVSIAHIRSALAELIRDDNLVYSGVAGFLLPRNISHILTVCLLAKLDYRVDLASMSESISSQKAKRMVVRKDNEIREWALTILGKSPWDKNLYDLFLPMDTMTVDAAVQIICKSATNPALVTNQSSKMAMGDFLIKCRVHESLGDNMNDIDISCEKGEVVLTMNRFVIRLEHFQKTLEKIAADVPGVTKVVTRIGPRYRQASYPNVEPPPKILLVDDEVEFVQTLSERLEVRNLGATIAFCGEEALSIVENDPPEVMVLDLKMPGINGLDVLRQVKKTRPGIEVIILTGHGADAEQERASELGAFAYLHKPVDINILEKTMKEACRKIEQSRNLDKD